MTREQPRPEAVDAVLRALIEMNPEALVEVGYITPAERAEGENLWAATLDASRGYQDRKVAALAYLARAAPGRSVGEAIEHLTGEQLAELEQIAEGAVSLDELLGRWEGEDS